MVLDILEYSALAKSISYLFPAEQIAQNITYLCKL